MHNKRINNELKQLALFRTSTFLANNILSINKGVDIAHRIGVLISFNSSIEYI